jgi:hypothetical protein
VIPRAALVALVLLAPACATEGLAFVQDQRVEIVRPEGNSTVTLPVTFEWRVVEDFEITGPDGERRNDAGYFGLFLDQTPVPPGETLAYVARDDAACKRLPGCPDETYLADRLIWSTSETSFTLEHLPDLDTASGHETHEFTVVLLDGTGRRIGESAWFVTFFYERQGDL